MRRRRQRSRTICSPSGVVADERHAAVRRARRAWPACRCRAAARRSAAPAPRVSSSRQRLASTRAQARGVGRRTPPPAGPPARSGWAQHLERVAVARRGGGSGSAPRRGGRQLGQHRLAATPSRSASSSRRARRRAIDQPAQLGEHALGGGLGHPRGGRAREPLGLGVGREAELGGEARQAQRPAADRARRRPGPSTRSMRGLEVGAAAVRVDQLAAAASSGHRARHRVDGEVALAQVGLDRVALERRTVVHAAGRRGRSRARRRTPPTAGSTGPRELARQGARGRARGRRPPPRRRRAPGGRAARRARPPTTQAARPRGAARSAATLTAVQPAHPRASSPQVTS